LLEEPWTIEAGWVIRRRKRARWMARKSARGERRRYTRGSERELTIKKLTAGLSIFNRITGVGLSGLLYVGSIAYLLHPLYPAIDSVHLVQLVSDLPTWFKGSVKLVAGGAFWLHTYNGIRHLMWDMGKGMFCFISLLQISLTCLRF
jgi:succinate dehydrogenase/fumarate reductase cytochrome b subunit